MFLREGSLEVLIAPFFSNCFHLERAMAVSF